MAKLYDKVKSIFGQEEETKRLREYYREAEFAMRSRREKWKQHYQYWINKKMTKREAYLSDLRVNYCFVVTNVKIPVMTQSKPTVTFISFDKGMEAEVSADLYTKLVGNALWNKLEIQKKLSNSCWNASVYDAAWWKVGWNSRADKGIGEVFVSSVDPFKILPDPHNSEVANMRYIIHVEPYSVSELKDQYPRYAEQIKPDKEISTILYEERKWEDRDANSGGYVDSTTRFAVERAFKKEYWISPKGCLEFDEETKKKKYPNGKVVVMIGDVIVDEFANPYDHGELPFVPQIMNEIGNDLFGIGDIEQIIPLQDGLNHAYQQIDDIVSSTANLGYTAHPDIGFDNLRKMKKDLRRPGAIKVAPPELFRQDEPPKIPAFLQNRVEDLVQRLMDVSGINEILMGSGRVTHRTFRGIERLFEAGTSRIGKSIQHMERSLKKVAFLMAEMARQYYTEPRVFTVIGGNGQVAGVLTVGPEMLQGRFEASVDSGATLPRDKQSRADLALNLYQAGVLQMALSPDPSQKMIAKTVLDTVEFPGREALLQTPPPQSMMQPEQQDPLGLPPPEGQPLQGNLPPEVEEMAAAAGMTPDELLQVVNQLPM